MARITQDTPLQSPTARARLAPRSEPYFRSVQAGLAIGYRRGRHGGTWLARIRLPDTASYLETKLGFADDASAASTAGTLSYDRAVGKAREAFVQAEARRGSGVRMPAGSGLVDDVLDLYRDAYLAGKTGRRREPGRDIANVDSILKCHLRPRLGHLRSDRLNAETLESFKRDLAAAPRLSRSGRPVADAGADEWDESETQRKRKARANRVMTVLRAALNLAFKERWLSSDASWRTALAPYAGVDVASIRFLEISECDALKGAVDPDFRDLVRGALNTGCRYGSLRFLRSGDVNLKARTALVRVTKSGDMQNIRLSREGCDFLEGLVADRPRGSFVFVKSSGAQWKPSDQQRRMQDGCVAAGISPAVTFHELRDTFASHLVMAGVPLLTVSKLLGHKDSRTTEKYYAHLAQDHLKKAIDDHLPRF